MKSNARGGNVRLPQVEEQLLLGVVAALLVAEARQHIDERASAAREGVGELGLRQRDVLRKVEGAYARACRTDLPRSLSADAAAVIWVAVVSPRWRD